MWDGRKGKSPIESYSRDKNPAAAFGHPSQLRPVVFSKRKHRRRKQTIEEQLEENRVEINRLYDTRGVIVSGGRESIAKSAEKDYRRLWTRRLELHQQLGSRGSSEVSLQIHRNGVAYVATPLLAHLEDCLAAFNAPAPTPYGPHRKRDRLVRFLWESRSSGFIAAGRAPKASEPQGEVSTFPRITKTYLRRRFKIGARRLARILSAP